MMKYNLKSMKKYIKALRKIMRFIRYKNRKCLILLESLIIKR